MKHLICFLTFAGLFFSCQHEEADAPFATDTDISVLPSTEKKASDNGLLGWVALTGQTHISAEEAQETALATAMQMREVEGIVTKAPLKIGSIEVVKGDTRKPYVPTKGNAKPEQADVYIVNFANNQGYVVTSADRRVPGVLAYNSYGHLGDTISNPGEAILFSYMQEYIEEQRADFEANKEKLATQEEENLFRILPKKQQEKLIAKGLFNEKGKRLKSKFHYYDEHNPRQIPDGGFNSHEEYWKWFCDDPKNYGREFQDEGYAAYDKWYMGYVKPPLLKTLWGQSGRYNDKVSKYCDADSDQSPVGCVATAVGQLLAYHKKPAIFKGRTMHWEDMTKIDSGDMFSNMNSNSILNNPTATEDIQYLLAHLGDGDLLAMNYGCRADGGSGSNRALEALQKLEYNVHTKDYERNNVLNEIKKDRPVYVEGCLNKTERKFLGIRYYLKYSNCHAWVIDGYADQRKRTIIYYVFSCSADDVTTSYEGYKEESNEFFHHNFGWGGSPTGFSYGIGTGWYNIILLEHQRGHSRTFKSPNTNFKYNNKIITVNK